MGSSRPSHTFTNPPGLYDPRPNGYTHVVEATTPARVVYVAGMLFEIEATAVLGTAAVY